MQNVTLIPESEKKELETILDIITLASGEIDEIIDPDEEDDTPMLEDIQRRLSYIHHWLDRADDTMRNALQILYGAYDPEKHSLGDFELPK